MSFNFNVNFNANGDSGRDGVKDTDAKAKDKDMQRESLCRCSAKLCTIYQRIRLTGTPTFGAIPHKNDAAN